jgi:chromosomal replication initiator protein
MDERCKALWEKLSAALKPQVSSDTYKRWFSAVELIKATEDSLTFHVPNNIYQFWIESNHMAALQSAITSALGAPRTVRFLSATESDNENDFGAPEVEKSDRSSSKATGPGLGLNPRNTFESFVVGPNNQIAHAASLAVAQSPARTYNPLFVYGGVGLGKTHLMQAIGQYVWAKKKTSRVMYLSSELFINEFIDAIQHNTLVKFRKRYRQADLLLIDDIQFLAGKERSQEEFFHTYSSRIPRGREG